MKIQCQRQLIVADIIIGIEMQTEHIGMYAGIGPAASGDIGFKAQHLFQSRLHTGLYTDAVWLYLPAAVTAAVIFNCQQSPFQVYTPQKMKLIILSPNILRRTVPAMSAKTVMTDIPSRAENFIIRNFVLPLPPL